MFVKITQFPFGLLEDDFGLNIFDHTTSDYNKKMHDSNSKEKMLTVAHFNCRSLKKNIDSLECVLSEMKCPFSIIAVSETWFKTDECVYINVYQFVGKGRAEKRGGGVQAFI